MDRGHRATPVKFLIRDRAGQFTGASDAVSTANGTRIPASPPQAPRANATCERIIGTLRWELSGQLLIVNEHHLRRVLTEYLQHYNTAWPHRALGQLLRDVDLEDGRAADLEDVWGVENPAGWGPAGLGGAQGVAGGAQGVAVISVIAVRAAL